MTIAHIVSLFLTGMVFYVSGKHIIDLRRPAQKAIENRMGSFVGVICLSVFIGSLGDFLDNGYWGAAWTADGLKHVRPWVNTSRNWLFGKGVVVNIPFRQLSDLVSNYGLALAIIMLSESLDENKDYKVISRRRYHKNLLKAALFSALVVGIFVFTANAHPK